MTAEAEATSPLRLRATDAEDLLVISASLQDAIVPLPDMTFLEEDRQFVMVVNRFKWECGGLRTAGGRAEAEGGRPVYLRTNCGVRFCDVEAVRRNGVDPRDRGRMLELLAVQPAPEGILLAFAEHASVHLVCPTVNVVLQDLGEPWPTLRRPSHPLDGDEPSALGAVTRAARPFEDGGETS